MSLQQIHPRVRKDEFEDDETLDLVWLVVAGVSRCWVDVLDDDPIAWRRGGEAKVVHVVGGRRKGRSQGSQLLASRDERVQVGRQAGEEELATVQCMSGQVARRMSRDDSLACHFGSKDPTRRHLLRT